MTELSFLLIIAGKNDPKARKAIKNIDRICINQKFNLTILDLNENPQIAKYLKVIATPFLIKTLPKPSKKIIGDLSNLTINYLLEEKNYS